MFALDTTAGAILDAIRNRRTVVYGLDGRPYGDPTMAAALAAHLPLLDAATKDPPVGWLDIISRVCGVVGLTAVVLWGPRRRDALGRPDPVVLD